VRPNPSRERLRQRHGLGSSAAPGNRSGNSGVQAEAALPFAFAGGGAFDSE
jgi:hypothetical protein